MITYSWLGVNPLMYEGFCLFAICYTTRMEIISNPVELAKKLVSIRSESGGEKEVAEYIFEYLRALGLPAEKLDVGEGRFCVFVAGEGEGKAGKCEVLFINHIDTVPVGEGWSHEPFGEIKDGKLYGRGSCDNKGSGACLLAALAGAAGSRTSSLRSMSVCFTVGEENTFIGIKAFIKKMAQDGRFKNIKYCINLEPTELKIVHAHKGQIHLTIRAHGKAAHASEPGKGVNAILKLNRAINSLREFNETFVGFEHGLLGHPAMNIGVIKGGTASNIVPDFAEMEVDVRIVPGQSGGKVVEEIEKAIGTGNPVTSDSLEIIINHIYSPVEMPSSSPFIENFRKILKEEGIDSEPEIGGYTTEFSELSETGIEGFIFGAGSINQAHKIDEFVRVEELEKLYKVLGKFLGDF